MTLSLRMTMWALLIGLTLTTYGCDTVANDGKTDTSELNQQSQSDVPALESDSATAQNDSASESSDALLDESEVAELDSTVPEEEGPVTFMPLSEGGDVVSFVEVERYMGRWYEIATTPSFQQSSCYNTQAEYTFNEAMGWVDVVNTCSVGSTSGNKQQIQGRAELVDLETQAKLKVIFFGQAAPYWVVALDGTEGSDPYQWVVVSVPGKSVIWILSRTKQLLAEEREAIESHLIERGFPVDTLIDTPHAE